MKYRMQLLKKAFLDLEYNHNHYKSQKKKVGQFAV